MSRQEIQRALYGRRKNQRVETSIQTAVLDWCNTLPDAMFFRRNVGAAKFTDDVGATRFVRFNEAGMSDVWGILQKVHTEIELKKPGEEPTGEQAAWLALTRERGCIAFWCDSLESCVIQMRAEFQQRGWTWRRAWEV